MDTLAINRTSVFIAVRAFRRNTRIRTHAGEAATQVFSMKQNLLSLRSRPATSEGEAPSEKFSPLMEECVGLSLKLFDVVKKIGPLSENSSPHLVSQAGYGPASYMRDITYSQPLRR